MTKYQLMLSACIYVYMSVGLSREVMLTEDYAEKPGSCCSFRIGSSVLQHLCSSLHVEGHPFQGCCCTVN